jgi:hypothetical protein
MKMHEGMKIDEYISKTVENTAREQFNSERFMKELDDATELE